MKSLGKFLTIISLVIVGGHCSAVFANHHHHHGHIHHYYKRTVRHTVVRHSTPPSNPLVYGSGQLTDEINQALQRTNSDVDVGVQIKSMKTGEILYSRNAQQEFTPASILKILTAEAALLYLGPNYKFPTRVLTDAKSTSGGMLNGNIYLVHSGDPSLTSYDLNDLMVALKAQQILGINGSIYIDNTAYDQSNFAPGWIPKDSRFCYGAPINASIINHNCVSFKVSPFKSVARPAWEENPSFFINGFNNAVVARPSSKKSCYVSLSTQPGNDISISGCVPRNRYSHGASGVISNIVQYNKSLMHNLFKHFGIRVNGNIEAKAAPANLSELALHESKPLHLLIVEMLKKSDNIIAGSLFKKLGELYTRQPGSWENGGIAVKQLLAEKASVDTSHMTIVDGSGLSRFNRVKPAQIMQVLDFAYHNDATNYQFITALPIAGVDGTLKHRMWNIVRKVRAKTGTMAGDGVVSLAGYAVSKDKEPIAFVIIFNGKHSDIWQYREIEDKIATSLANYSRS